MASNPNSPPSPFPCANHPEIMLNYMSKEDPHKTKGVVNFYCPQCTMRYFGDAETLTAYTLKQKQEARAKAREAGEK